ncbi:MAG: DUF2089 domain-containing protein [Armatimonadota bacterium]
MNEMVAKCPVCAADMAVTQLTCRACSTRVEGDFAPGRFSGLSAERWQFLETFLRCRGNLTDVQAELGISYPTARNRLDDLLAALGYTREPSEGHRDRLETLEALGRGEITVEQALAALRRPQTSKEDTRGTRTLEDP